jgi:hypothetical protein
MTKHITAAAIVLALSGCATMVNERTQTVQVDLVDDMGGTRCRAENDEGRYTFTGSTASVNRDNSDLVVTCDNKHQTAEAVIESKQEGSWYVKTFIVFFPCLITCSIDYFTGNAAYYPSPIQVMMDYKPTTTARAEQ